MIGCDPSRSGPSPIRLRERAAARSRSFLCAAAIGTRRHNRRIAMASDQNVNDRREWPPVRERAAQLPTVEARQGVTGHHVRHVLGFGLAAIVIAFAIIYIIYFA
jgi:hypothetical protein